MPDPCRIPSNGGLSPPLLLTVGCLALLAAACGGDSPIEPTLQVPPVSAEQQAEERGRGGNGGGDAILGIDELLEDQNFLAVIDGVQAPSLAQPLDDVVDALAKGQISKARSLIQRAAEEIDALAEDPTHFQDVLHWSILELLFEAAELI